MPFIIKASYDGKTRRWPQQSDVFPSYQSLSDQIHKVFQNVDNFYLTRVTFSPSTTNEQTPNAAQFVLIATAVHSADEWANTAAAPFLGVSYPTGMLKFIVNDKLPHKEAPIRGGPWANAMDVDVEPRFPIPPLPRMPRGFVPIPPPIPPVPTFAPPPMSGPRPFIPFIPPPPPPGLMTQPPPRPVPAPSLRSVPSNLSATSAGAASSFTVGASSSTSTCCSVDSARTEVKGMMDSFLKEFQKTVADNFGAEHAGEDMDTSSPIVPDRTPLAPNRPLSPVGNIPGAFNAPNSPAEPVVHNNVICDHCEKTVKGIRYKCNDCPDFDICESCMGENNNGAVIHNVQLEKNHTFKAIPKPVTAQSPTPPPTHNASCDVCRKTIVGSRHKCLDCPDYDLCDKCVVSHRDKHPAEHEFYEFKEPGKIVIHNVTRPFPRHPRGHHHPFGHHHHAGRGRPFGGRGGFAGRPASDRPHEESARGAPDVTVPPVGGRMPLVAHNATCDLCDSKIHGNRYKCSMCPDYDVCESCFSIVVEQHPKHAFVRIRDPKDVMVRSHHYANRTVHHARCDSCGKQIVGARFKCTHRDCPDFDLCENCEALPIEAHPSSHALIKLRHPISFYDGLAGVLEYAKATKEQQAEMMDAARTGVASPAPSSIWQPTVIRHVTEQGTPVPVVFRSPRPKSPTFCQLPPTPPRPAPVIISPQMPTATPHVIRLTSPTRSPTMPTPLRIPEEKVEQALPSASNPWVAEPVALEGEGEMVQMPLPVRPKPSPIVVPVPEGSLIELTRAMSIKTGSASPSLINTPSTVKSLLEEEEEEVVAAVAVPEEKMEVSVPPSMDDSASPFNDAHAVEVRRVDDDAVSVVSAAPSVISVAPSVASVAPSVVSAAPSVVSLASRAPSVISRAPSVVSLASSHSSIRSAPRPSATFVADITIPDGHILPPGAFFVKTWKMLNDGEVPWPAGTRLAFTGGERFGTNSAEHLLIAGLTPPGEMTELRVEFRAPEEAGRYISNWRLQDEEGRLFGHRIWCDIEVVDPVEPARNRAVEGVRELSSKSSHSSLSSSSIMIMPASAVLSEEAVAAASAAAASAVASPVQAPVATPTLSSFDGDASDIGSHVSSVADDDVFSVADSDFQWEEASRPQSPDQFVMVYETSNDGSDSDD